VNTEGRNGSRKTNEGEEKGERIIQKLEQPTGRGILQNSKSLIRKRKKGRILQKTQFLRYLARQMGGGVQEVDDPGELKHVVLKQESTDSPRVRVRENRSVYKVS